MSLMFVSNAMSILIFFLFLPQVTAAAVVAAAAVEGTRAEP